MRKNKVYDVDEMVDELYKAEITVVWPSPDDGYIMITVSSPYLSKSEVVAALNILIQYMVDHHLPDCGQQQFLRSNVSAKTLSKFKRRVHEPPFKNAKVVYCVIPDGAICVDAVGKRSTEKRVVQALVYTRAYTEKHGVPKGAIGP